MTQPEEAKVLAEKAAAHLQAVGPDKAIADFNDPAAGCIDRELFVVVHGPDNKILSGYAAWPAIRSWFNCLVPRHSSGTRGAPCDGHGRARLSP